MNCPPPVTVCQLCKELLIPETNAHDDQTSSSKRESYRNRQTLKHSADQGCFLCSRIRELLGPFDEQTTPNDEDSPSSPDKPNIDRPRGAMVCLAVTYSSFLLLAQFVEGYWVCQICAGLTPIRFTEWTKSTSHFNPAVLRYIFNLRAVVVLLPMWLGPLGFGAVILDVQWRYTKELLMLKIKDQDKGHCQGRQCDAETGNRRNGSEVDLESGLFMADKDVPENLFGTTYR
ncbi:hypothetical protein MRS44_014796 [Fusarium solani]|uniref:uncharacterized protein n=1 Tax=Fusarium solani TaxID=169388 RepID=UPI0032C42C44|nr:hypothetical protein MRS44_014796 [Fusarium solani]